MSEVIVITSGKGGVGKTTTIAKLAKKEKDNGKKVMLVAADTFRAGATEQLQLWGEKIGVKVISGKENSEAWWNRDHKRDGRINVFSNPF